MATRTIDEVQGRLREVLAGLRPGEELVLTDNGQPLARLMREQPKPERRPPPGLGQGMISFIADDFDAPHDHRSHPKEPAVDPGRGCSIRRLPCHSALVIDSWENNVTQRTFTDEVLDDRTAAILRQKTPAERLAISFEMWRFAQQMIRLNLQRQHPDWSPEQIQRETARRMSHGAV